VSLAIKLVALSGGQQDAIRALTEDPQEAHNETLHDEMSGQAHE
jgi:hypothetical protein